MWAVNVLLQEGLKFLPGGEFLHHANEIESKGLKMQFLGAESPFTEGGGVSCWPLEET